MIFNSQKPWGDSPSIDLIFVHVLIWHLALVAVILAILNFLYFRPKYVDCRPFDTFKMQFAQKISSCLKHLKKIRIY